MKHKLFSIYGIVTCIVLVFGFAASGETGRIYFTDIVTQVGTAAVIKRVDPDGLNLTTLVTGLKHPRGIVVDVVGGKMYWMELGLSAIRRANLDGSGVETFLSTGDAGGGIAIDSAARKLYWISQTGSPPSNQKIRRANLDGTGQEDIVTTGLVSLSALALDTLHGKVYWTDLEGNYTGTGSIHRADLNGLNAETLLTGIDEANGIAVDASGGKIYWTEISTHRIQRANLNGTSVENVVVGINTPATLSLDLGARKIYWSDAEWNGQVNQISKANFDGSGVESIVTGGFPFGVSFVAGPTVALIKAVKPSFSYLSVGNNYQLQISTALNTWTNSGSAFTATNSNMTYPQYWDVDSWNQLFFRLQVVP